MYHATNACHTLKTFHCKEYTYLPLFESRFYLKRKRFISRYILVDIVTYGDVVGQRPNLSHPNHWGQDNPNRLRHLIPPLNGARCKKDSGVNVTYVIGIILHNGLHQGFCLEVARLPGGISVCYSLSCPKRQPIMVRLAG